MIITKLKHYLGRAVIGLIQLYRLVLGPWLGRQCRFHPSCSVYAQTAVERFGPFKGSYLALRRLGRCHPFHAGGYDPVPDAAKADAA